MQFHIEALEKHPCQLCRDKGYTCIATADMLVPRNYDWAYKKEKDKEKVLELLKNQGGNLDVQI